MIPLRPYQHDAIERVHAYVTAGVRRVLLVAPTGAGKTVIAAFIIVTNATAGRRVLFVAHRRELIDQCYRKLLDSGLAEDAIGVVMARDPRRRPDALVQVASVDTLRGRAKPPADLVIVDEAHRALAKTYRDLAAAYPEAVHLGLTATPYRADGRGLGDAYDALVVVASPRQLIEEGFLVKPVVYTVPDDHLPDLSGVRVRGGDYDDRELAEAVDRKALVGDIVEHWARQSGRVRTVVFAVSIAHSRHIAERFKAIGIRAEHLDGETHPAERQAILDRLDRGQTQVVTNVGVLCEGWDQPSVKCCVLARPTKSTGMYLQQAGRILRPWKDPSSAREVRAVILDHAGCAIEHGLPDDDREFTLESARRKRRAPEGKAKGRAKVCDECCAVNELQTRFCTCGFAFYGTEPTPLPQEVPADLVELTSTVVDEKREAWDRLCAVAKAEGRKERWVRREYRALFGVAPPASFAFDSGPKTYTDEEKRLYFAELVALAQSRGWRLGYVFARYRERFGEAPPADLDTFSLADAPRPVDAPAAEVRTEL